MNDKRILVVQTAFVGDVILITPLIRAINQLFPNAKIDAMVIKETKSILSNNPYLNAILVFDKRKNKLFSLINLVFKLRKNQYDMVLTPHSSFTTSVLLKLAGIPERIGFDRYIARYNLSKRVPWISGQHRILNNLNLLSILSERKWDMQTELFPSEKDKMHVNHLLEGIKKHTTMLAIAPGSVWKTKCWEESSYVQLTKDLADSGYTLIFTGSPDERALCDRIITSAGISAINLAGKTSILESAEIIHRCRLLICNDSGALHLANAMKTDVYAFFGPTVRRIGYYPYRKNDKIFEVDLPCRPCGSHGARVCPEGHHNCMKLINPEAVVNEIRKHYPIERI